MPLPRSPLNPATTVALVVDIQEKLLPSIHEAETVRFFAERMLDAARILDVPLVTTEQYPAGLGPTVGSIRDRLEDTPVFEKTRFSACTEPVLDHLKALARPRIIVVGIEAHVCVQQTVLDLLRLGYEPYVCADAVGSRRPLDSDCALHRMRQGGAIVTTTESVTFELLGEAGNDAFKRILKVVK